MREGRGDRLSGPDEQIFSGLFWTGEQGLELGLIDGFGSSGYVARELIGAEDIVDFTPDEDLLERLSKRLGAGIGSALGRFFGFEDAAPLLR